MRIALTYDDREYVVWAMLDDEIYNGLPHKRGESFVIGSGKTLDEAVEVATLTLAEAAEQVMSLGQEDAIKISV